MPWNVHHPSNTVLQRSCMDVRKLWSQNSCAFSNYEDVNFDWNHLYLPYHHAKGTFLNLIIMTAIHLFLKIKIWNAKNYVRFRHNFESPSLLVTLQLSITVSTKGRGETQTTHILYPIISYHWYSFYMPFSSLFSRFWKLCIYMRLSDLIIIVSRPLFS